MADPGPVLAPGPDRDLDPGPEEDQGTGPGPDLGPDPSLDPDPSPGLDLAHRTGKTGRRRMDMPMNAEDLDHGPRADPGQGALTRARIKIFTPSTSLHNNRKPILNISSILLLNSQIVFLRVNRIAHFFSSHSPNILFFLDTLKSM